MEDDRRLMSVFAHGSLKVSEDRRHLVFEDGAPFFWLGDTAWELFHRLTREEAVLYFNNRRQKGFSVIQAVVLAELDGLNTPNAYGDKPIFDNDPLKPNEAYFQYIDEIIHLAEAKGLFIGLLPTWGDKVEKLAHGVGPVIFNEENAFQYGRWIGSRYRNFCNIIWINGGDRGGNGKNFAVWDALGRGIKVVDSNHLMSFHPPGGGGIGYSSSRWFHQSDWLDFNMAQSGHEYKDLPNYRLIEDDYALFPPKPCMDAEPRYENHCVNWNPEQGWFDDYDVRQAVYWSLFSGAFGVTYGCHSVWQFLSSERAPVGNARGEWKEALNLPGAGQLTYARKLLGSRDMLGRTPDSSLLKQPGSGCNRAAACRGEDYAFVYLPTGDAVTVNFGKIAGEKITSAWFNPRNGLINNIGAFDNVGQHTFTPPTRGRGNDWILIIDRFAA
jgi:hypothetical protein